MKEIIASYFWILHQIFGNQIQHTIKKGISGNKCDRDKLIFFCRKRGSDQSGRDEACPWCGGGVV